MRVQPVEINWHPKLSIFASEHFLKVVGDEYGWLGGFTESGELRCVLPYTIIRKAIFRMVRFRIETIPIAQDFDVAEEKSFLNGAIGYLRSIGADLIIPATTNTIFRTYPDGAIVAPYGTYIIDLNQSEEVLWGNLNSTYRKKIRNSIKNGVQIRTGIEYLDTAYEIIRDTLKRSSLGFMKHEALRRLVLGLKENVKIFVADNQGTIQGCTIFPFSNYAAYSLYGGRIPQAETGAMNLLNWEAIRQFREMGVNRFDFMGVRIDPEPGSKQEGIKIFKQRFGGQPISGYLWKYSLRFLGFQVYCLAVRLSRGGDIVDAERHKLKNFSAKNT